MSEGVAISRAGGVLGIRLDRPDRKNALDTTAVARIVAVLEDAATDDDLRVVVLSGTGDDFCAGADWVATNTAGATDTATNAAAANTASDARPRTGSIQRRLPLQAHRLVELLVELQLPVVCVVRGWAAGLGFQLALAADFTVAGHTSRFWEPFLERGFSPDSGATWLLPRLVGLARAKELLLLGRTLAGPEAAEWGLIHRAVPDDELDREAEALVRTLAAAPTVAVGLTKRCLHRGLALGLREAMDAEAGALELSARTRDFKEGLAAFRQGRTPRFEGR